MKCGFSFHFIKELQPTWDEFEWLVHNVPVGGWLTPCLAGFMCDFYFA